MYNNGESYLAITDEGGGITTYEACSRRTPRHCRAMGDGMQHGGRQCTTMRRVMAAIYSAGFIGMKMIDNETRQPSNGHHY